MMRLPIRKSPCTKTFGDEGGRCAASHRKAHSNVAVVSRHLVELGVPVVELIGLLESDARRVGSVDGRQRACALADEIGPRLVVQGPLNASHDRLAADEVAHQERIAKCDSGIVGDHHVWHRGALRGRPPRGRRLQLHARMDLVRRTDAQDQVP